MNPVAFTAIALTIDTVATLLIVAITWSPWAAVAPWSANTIFAYPAAPIRVAAWFALLLLFTGAMNSRKYHLAGGLVFAVASPGMICAVVTMTVLAFGSANTSASPVSKHTHTDAAIELSRADKSD